MSIAGASTTTFQLMYPFIRVPVSFHSKPVGIVFTPVTVDKTTKFSDKI